MSAIRKFTWCPERAISNCLHWWPVPHMHVAIRTPGAPYATPQCEAKPLHLDFVDLDPEAIRRTEAYRKNPVRGEGLIADCFTEAHAAMIADFVESRPSEVLLIVNCEAGVSRSAGIVLALRRHYGGDESEIFEKASPNIHVTSVLTRELRNRKLRALQVEQEPGKEDHIMKNDSREPGRSGRRFGEHGETHLDLEALKRKCERFEAALRDIASREHSCVGGIGPCRCSICTAAEALRKADAI